MGELGQAEIKVKLNSAEADAELDRLEARVDRVFFKLQAFSAKDDARVLDLVKRGIRCGWDEHQTDRSIGSLAHDLDQMARAIIAKARRQQAAQPDDDSVHERKGNSRPEQGQVWRTKAPHGPMGERQLTLVLKVDYTPQYEVWVTHTSLAGDYRRERDDFLSAFEQVPGLGV